MNYTKLGERLNRFEYSINTDNDKYRYRLKTQSDFYSSKNGICWDLANYLAFNIPKSEFYYMALPNMAVTHTFVIYPDHGKWCYFDSSWGEKDFRGIFEYDTKKELLEWITKRFLRESGFDYEKKEYVLMTKPNYTKSYIPFGKNGETYLKWVYKTFKFVDGDKKIYQKQKEQYF